MKAVEVGVGLRKGWSNDKGRCTKLENFVQQPFYITAFDLRTST